MPTDPSRLALLALFAGLTLLLVVRRALRCSPTVAVYLPYLWALGLFFLLREWVSFGVAVWVLMALCFLALREYFTLVDLRLQDRAAVWAAYAAIPFMFYYVATDWHGMFIITIPIFAFLVVPFLISLGGAPEGSVVSVGVIDLGLFLLVFCVGHVGYLAYYSTWMALFVVGVVVLTDLAAHLLRARQRPFLSAFGLQVLPAAPFTVALGWGLMPWTGIPLLHTVAVALMVPGLVAVGCHTIAHLEADLRIDRSRLRPGRGEVIDALKSYPYAAPVAFHYLRHVLDAF